MRQLVASVVLALLAPFGPHQDAPDTAAGPLPFEMPSPDVLRASDRRVYAHYVPVFPISIDNQPSAEDYYTTDFLSPDGEGGKHRDYGGFLRSRPLPRDVNPAADWELADMRTDVARAAESGFDGFVVDVFGLDGSNWDRVVLLLDAARDVDPEFDIILAPGANTGVVDDPEALADAMAELADHPSAARDAIGRLVIAPFLAEGVGADYWRDWIELMAERDVDIAFVPILLDYDRSIDDFADLSVGVAAWGPRSVAGIDDLTEFGEDAAERSLIWMQPVAMQDTRPKDGVFDEADNTETLRAMWATADEVDAAWVDVVTWNDYSESTQTAPSTNIGASLLDVHAYYLVTFKTGTPPPIVRDRVFVSHRIQPVDAEPTGGQTTLMELRRGSSAASDEVEVLTFLRTGATVDVTVGASRNTYEAPAGVHAELFPLEPGTISVTTRAADGYSASVTSPYEVVTEPVVQDLEYRVVGSGRDGEHVAGPATPPASTDVPAADATTVPATDPEGPIVSAGASSDTTPPPTTPTDGGDGSPWVPVAVAAVVIIGLAVALAAARRSRRRAHDAERAEDDVE